MAVKEGDKVKIEYTGKFPDGEVFDSSKNHGKPLEFVVGQKQVIPGFETALVGMSVGEEKEITIEPKDAYGERREDMVKEVPKSQLPQDQEPKEGMMLMMALPNGMQLPAKITKIGEQNVFIDLNHPLAGKTLIFELKVEAIEEASTESKSLEEEVGTNEVQDDKVEDKSDDKAEDKAADKAEDKAADKAEDKAE